MIDLPENIKKIKYNPLCEGIREDILIKEKDVSTMGNTNKKYIAISAECIGEGNNHLEALINLYKVHDINIEIESN